MASRTNRSAAAATARAVFILLPALTAVCWLLTGAAEARGGPRGPRSATSAGPTGAVGSLCYGRRRASATARSICGSIGSKGAGGCGSESWLLDFSLNGATPVCTDEACPRGMSHVRLTNRQWDCDCQPFHTFWLNTTVRKYEGECYPVLSRGPCPERHLLVREPEVNSGACAPHPCPEGQFHVRLDLASSTVHLAPPGHAGASCQSPGVRGALCAAVGPEQVLQLAEGELSCVHSRLHAAIILPPPRVVTCTRGKKLTVDEQGNASCRRVLG